MLDRKLIHAYSETEMPDRETHIYDRTLYMSLI